MHISTGGVVFVCLLGRDSREENHTECVNSVLQNAGACVKIMTASAYEAALLHMPLNFLFSFTFLYR
jgi:hypothetical protein